jgi:Na+/H+-dicarboxylate symporter
MIDAMLFNPLALLFLSFAIGAFLHALLSKFHWYKLLDQLNFISDKMTKQIGVLRLEWFILKTPLRVFNQALKIEGRPTKEQLIKLREVMTAAELSHLIGFVVLIPFIIYYITSGQSLLLIISITVLNILFNGYTALTQQFNKRRLDRLLTRMAS